MVLACPIDEDQPLNKEAQTPVIVIYTLATIASLIVLLYAVYEFQLNTKNEHPRSFKYLCIILPSVSFLYIFTHLLGDTFQPKFDWAQNMFWCGFYTYTQWLWPLLFKLILFEKQVIRLEYSFRGRKV